MKAPKRETHVAIVGPCAAGKTTLAEGLRSMGINARQIAQEHSYVPDMWQILTKPKLLLYLDAGYETCSARKNLHWTPEEYEEQVRRLAHAKDNCDIYIRTDELDIEQVLNQALKELN